MIFFKSAVWKRRRQLLRILHLVIVKKFIVVAKLLLISSLFQEVQNQQVNFREIYF